jgi:hypothetical protein
MKRNSHIRIMLASSLTVAAFSAHGRSDVVLVEPIVQSEAVSGYALVKLSGSQNTPKTLTTSKEPLQPLACNGTSIIYLDQEGTIWRLPVGGGDPVLVGATRFVPKEDTVGKTILDLEDRALFAVVNSYPETTERTPDRRYTVVKYSFDGQQIQIGSGDGNALALWRISADVLEVVSSIGLADYDLKKGPSSKIRSIAPNDFAEAALVKSGFGVFADFRVIRVRKGLAGPLVAEFSTASGLRLIADIDADARTVLSIFLNEEMNGARIDELDMRTGAVHERYLAKGIGTALYCGE